MQRIYKVFWLLRAQQHQRASSNMNVKKMKNTKNKKLNVWWMWVGEDSLPFLIMQNNNDYTWKYETNDQSRIFLWLWHWQSFNNHTIADRIHELHMASDTWETEPVEAIFAMWKSFFCFSISTHVYINCEYLSSIPIAYFVLITLFCQS